MNQWKPLHSIAQVDDIKAQSYESRQIIFKHSTRCNISEDAYQELSKGGWSLYYLDLLSYRTVSDYISEAFGVRHQSPQILIIDQGACVYHESHWRISNGAITAAIDK